MFLLDLRHAARLFVSSRGFTTVAVLTLALGIGATTAIFSVVDAVLLRVTPLPDTAHLGVVWETDRQSGTTREPGSLPDFLDYRERTRSLESLAAFLALEVNYAPARGEPQRLQSIAVSESFLPMLRVQPAAGRVFTSADMREGSPPVVIVSAALAQRAFPETQEVVGRDLRIDGQLHTVVGVMPDGSDFGVFQVLRAAAYSRSFADRATRAGVDVWLPLQDTPQSLPRSTHPLFMMGRMRDGAPATQRELSAIAADLERAYPENAARGTFVEPFESVVFGPVRPALLVLLAAVGLVLLVACANVANLLLARGTARRREVAVRLAIGATRWQLARQFAAEGVLLTLAAGLLGVLVATYGVRGLVALAPADLPRIAAASVNVRVLLVTLLVALGAGFGFGLVPTLQARRLDVQDALKTDVSQASAVRGERVHLRSALVVSEFALAVMLVIGAALLVQSFWRLNRVNAGFDTHGVLKAQYQLPPDRYPVDFKRFPDFTEMHTFTHGLLARTQGLPGVLSVAIAGNHPIDPGYTNSFSVVGREAESRSFPEVSVRRVTPGYFRTMSVPLVRGRLLRDADSTTAPPVLMVNEAAARRFFDAQDPVGKQIRFWGASRTVVGIVGDERFHGLAEAAPPAVYTPLDQTPSADGAGVLLVRVEGAPSTVASAVRAAIHEQDPQLAVFGLEPLDDTLARSVGERRFTMLVLGLLATVALLLAAIGIHGVLSYTVGQRTREIGIRVALGAHPARLRRLVIGEGMRLACAGAALGVAGALALSRLLSALLYGVGATDAVTFITVPVLLCVVALAASYLPARRATQVDPITAIRSL
jgi:putative ABC transport system permease protein